MLTIFWFVIFVLSFFVLIQASRYFVESAERLGLKLGMPSFMVGITIVAVGTSFPELAVSIIAVVSGATEIVVGNVIGSNVTNIFLILGVTAIAAGRIKITRELLSVVLSFIVGSSFLLVAALLDRQFTISEALLFIAGFIVYVLYALTIEKEGKHGKMVAGRLDHKGIEGSLIMILVASPVVMYFGAEYTIKAVLKLSEFLNVGVEIIAASAIALGTSLPELAVSLSAVRKGKAEMAIGNILGSNIFNTFAVMGIPALFGTLFVPESMIVFGLPMLLIATFLYFFAIRDNMTTKWEGWMLVIFYFFFISELFSV